MASIRSRYQKLVADRQLYLDRARLAAKLTIPSLIPDDGHTSATTYDQPWQSIGSRGTNNLASKMLLALFPPNSPIFRMKLDEAELAQLDEGTRGDVELGLASYERVVTDDMENSATRKALFTGFKHLIVAGNTLLYEDPVTDAVRQYPLSRYVCKRNAAGMPLLCIAVDYTTWGQLPDNIVQNIVKHGGNVQGKKFDDNVEVYTRIRWWQGRVKVVQEIEGVMVPGSEADYPADSSPWIPLRYTAIDGESYGRSFVEEIYGDLNSCDALQQAVVEGAGASAIVKFLVDPNGATDEQDLVEAENGGFVTGRAQDVTVLQVNKFADMRVAKDLLAELKQDLSFAFLLHSSVQRDAERVTAEEIRFMAQELEDALGGIYSVLAQELQLPLVKSRIRKLNRQGKLPALPKSVKPSVITGLESLGRNHEQQRMRGFVVEAGQMFGPEVVAEYVRVPEYMKRSGAAWNVETNGLIRSDDEVAQNRADRAQAEAEAAAAVAAANQPQQ